MLDRCTIIRSVDARQSNHVPNKVFQTGHLDAEPRLDPSAEMSPGIGSVVAKLHGANHSSMPPYVAFQTSKSHIAGAGYLGRQYDPIIANRAAELPVYTYGKHLWCRQALLARRLVEASVSFVTIDLSYDPADTTLSKFHFVPRRYTNPSPSAPAHSGNSPTTWKSSGASGTPVHSRSAS